MKLVTAAIAAIALAGTASAAHAGGYVSLGIGADASLSGDMAQHFATDESDSSGRIALGQRFGRLALEVQLYGADMRGISARAGQMDYSTATAGVALKYFIPIGGNFEAYGKGGLDKTWLVADDSDMSELSGRGYNLGGGLQYSFDLSLLGGFALWLDYTHQELELADENGQGESLEGGTQMLTVGASLSF